MQLIRSGGYNLAMLGLNLQNRALENQNQAERDRISDAFRDRQQAQTERYQNTQLAISRPEERAKVAVQYGLQPNTPEFRSYVLNGTLPAPKSAFEQQLEQRRKAAEQLGIAPDHPAYPGFMWTGKLPPAVVSPPPGNPARKDDPPGQPPMGSQ